jgi:subfamily B ATP-binding cassette protein MsbA
MTAPLATPARRFWAFVRPHRNGLVISVLAFLLASATEPLVPWLLKYVLDEGFGTQMSFPLWAVPVSLVGLFFARGLFAFSGAYMMSRTATRTVLDIRHALISSVIRADAKLFNHMTPAEAVTKVVSNPHEITSLMSGALTTILRDGSTSVAMLVYLFYLNWRLTLLTLVVVPVLGVAVRLIHKRAKSLGTQAYASQMRLVSVVDDIARAWRVVRTFDAGEWERARFEREARHLQRMTLKNSSSSALMSPVSQVVASIGLALILTLALLQAQQSRATVGEFVAFITGMLLLISKVRHLTDVSQPVLSSMVVARGCFELLDIPPEPDTGTRSLDQAHGDIMFDQVVVRYEGAEAPALNGLDLHIAAGQTVALVGASGAGKSTIVSALLGFVAPGRGQIRLDGVDLLELKKASLRKQFAVVSQDIVLFDGSLADNVVYASPRDEQRLEQALRAAHLWDFARSQPQGLETLVGANGSKLSGGQRQRLAIARALYKDAPIWVFDEATSALDTESERAVQQALDQWHGRKTLIVIAHRLSTIRHADRIHVLAQGRVIEQGRHDELMARSGAYAAMVAAQHGA